MKTRTKFLAFCIVLLIVCMVLSWFFVEPEVSQDKAEIFERIAHNLFEDPKEGLTSLVINDDIKVKIDSETITFRCLDHSGEFIAREENGKIVMTWEPEIVLRILGSVLVGFLTWILVVFLIGFFGLIFLGVKEIMKK